MRVKYGKSENFDKRKTLLNNFYLVLIFDDAATVKLADDVFLERRHY